MSQAQFTPENVNKVAAEFLKVISRWFKRDGMYDEDNARVKCKKVTKELVLNSNDHFDANMAMDEALTNLNITIFDDNGEMSQDITDLWNAAWDKAGELAEQKNAA